MIANTEPVTSSKTMPARILIYCAYLSSDSLFASQVSKIAALGIGGVFVGLQALSYNGLIKIDYEGVQKKIEVSKRIICIIHVSLMQF